MSNSHISSNPRDLEVARAVVRAVKNSLPGDKFEVHDDTLFLSSESGTPRAAFAVVLPGIQFGVIPVDFVVPRGVDVLAGELAARLLETRAQWSTRAPGTFSPAETIRPTGGHGQTVAGQGDAGDAGDDKHEVPSTPGALGAECSPVTLGRSGVWLLTTLSGARLIVAVVVDPATKSPITTVTRYAAAGNGERFNGAPLSVDISEPPEVGMRFYANVIATDTKYYAHDRIVYGGTSAVYVSTPVTTIQEVTYEMLVAASPPLDRRSN